MPPSPPRKRTAREPAKLRETGVDYAIEVDRATSSDPREALHRVVDELPDERVAEVLDFALFVKAREAQEEREQLRAKTVLVPAASLEALAGLVSWGGDSLEDSERLYDE